MNKKTQGLPLNTIIIATIVLIVLVVLWAIFSSDSLKIFSNDSFKIPKYETVCNNLERLNNDSTISIYPEIINTRKEIENGWNMVISSMDGKNIEYRSWNDDGVTCIVPAEACIYNTYCIDIDMLVPVNYTEYDEWYNE